MTDERSPDGFWLDESANEWGYCNACGEECAVVNPCCDDGEVVPPDD